MTVLSSHYFLILLLIGWSSLINQTSGSYSLQIQFHRYNNPGSLDAAGECCDFVLFGGCGGCDTRFPTICLRNGGTSITQIGQCISGTRHNSGDIGGDSIEFSSTIGSLSNPFSYTGTAIAQGGYQLYVEVYDYDSVSSDDLVDRFVVSIPGYPSSLQSTTATGIYSRASLVLSYTLSCSQNYYGTDCSLYCIPRNDTQYGHYTCNSTTGDIICRDGWQNTTNNCTDVACNLVCHSPEGQCTSNGVCQCTNGWSGVQCNVPQCKEGCHPEGGYCLEPNQCLCHTNWNGTNCETALCSVNCSLIGGICSVPTECTCLAGYSGSACDIDMFPCDHQIPCMNGGSCYHVNDSIGQYTCTCQTGFTGTNCEIDIDECQTSPGHGLCHNNGTCTNGRPGTFHCICPLGWEGELCTVPIDYCESSPCVNDGTCVSLMTTHYCHCTEKYEGLNCELMKDDCIPNPCQNNGVCNNLITNYTCTCMEGFTGYNCEIIVQTVTSSSELFQRPSPTVLFADQSPSLLGPIIGPIVGLLVAAVVVIIILIAIMFYMTRKMNRKTNDNHKDRNVEMLDNFSYGQNTFNVIPSDYEQPTPTVSRQHSELQIKTAEEPVVFRTENIYETFDESGDDPLYSALVFNPLYDDAKGETVSAAENGKYYYSAEVFMNKT